MAGHTRYWSKKGSRGGRLFVLALVSAAVALSMGAAGLSVTITSPPDGTWVSGTNIQVNGTAVGPGGDAVYLDSDAQLAGGFETNTTVSGGKVIQTFPNTEPYVYSQDFNGLTGLDYVDAHWGTNINVTAWEISSLAPLSPTPPALAHVTMALESFTWMVALPGNATDGWISFRYFCEANGLLNVYTSTTGHPGTEAGVLSTGAVSGTGVWYNVTSQANGSDTFVVRFEAGATSPTTSYCSVDDFSAGFNFTREQEHTVSIADDFSDGESALWNAYAGGWAATNSSSLSGSPPAYGHSGMAATPTAIVIPLPNPLTRATVGFTYQCEPNATLNAFMATWSGSGFSILAGLRGAPSTTFYFDASVPLAGATSVVLGFDSDSTSSFGDQCGVDDLSIQVSYRGHLGLTFDGSYLSPISDLGIEATISSFGWWGSAVANTTVDVYARSSLNNLTFSAWTLVPPGGAVPSTPNGRYVQFRANFSSLGGFETASVDGFVANFSAIVSVEWTTNQVTWYLASGTSNWTASVPLGTGANTITIRARDTTGAVVTSQVQVSRDNIPPGPAGKPQAPAVTNGTSVSWNWTPATDIGVGISHYLVDVGLSLGGTELATGVVVNTTNFTYSNVPDGVTVYLSVRSVDGAGIPGLDRVTSNGTVVDRTAPGAVNVQSGAGFSGASSLTWMWNRPSDAGTGVAAYRVGIGSSAGANDVFSGNVTGTSYTLSSLTSGTTYYATVRAVDGAGNEGPTSTSGGVTSDLDPPQGPGAVTSALALTNASSITWQWSAATDAISGVDHYRVEVGTSPGAHDLADITTTELTYTLGFVESGTYVFVGVTPVDAAGNVGTRVDSAVVHSDSTAPSNTTLAKVDPYVSTTSIDLTWDAVQDGPTPGASGVDHYIVRVRSGGGVTESTEAETTFTLALDDGVTYTVEVLPVDAAGNVGPIATVTFTADRTGPATPGAVTTRVSNPLGPSFTASWNASVDAGSGLSEYRVSVGTAPGGTDIANAVRVTRLNYTWTGKEGTDYWVTVWAVDKLGNAGPSVQTTAPISYTPTAEGGGFLPGMEAVATALALVGAAAVSARRPGRPSGRRRRGMP